MKINDIKKIAMQHKIKVGKTNKYDLIRAIQMAEGYVPCFNTNISAKCGQYACPWREDCT